MLFKVLALVKVTVVKALHSLKALLLIFFECFRDVDGCKCFAVLKGIDAQGVQN